MMLKKEPAIIIAAIATMIQAVLIFVTDDITIDQNQFQSWLMPVLTMLVGLATRTQVFSANTLIEAGIKPETIDPDNHTHLDVMG